MKIIFYVAFFFFKHKCVLKDDKWSVLFALKMANEYWLPIKFHLKIVKEPINLDSKLLFHPLKNFDFSIKVTHKSHLFASNLEIYVGIVLHQCNYKCR